MKKIFLVAGELSGDKLGAWFLQQQHNQTSNFYIEAVGGGFLAAAGAQLYCKFEKLNVTGIIEIIPKIPFVFSFLNKLSSYILHSKFEEVVLIDFPGFNMMLAKKLKQKNKNIKIIYLSPPQLWCWGRWRLKNLRKFCDKLIVLYPFEVDWYKQQGVDAVWLGTPAFERLQPYLKKPGQQKSTIALIPGSRSKEIDNLFPILSKVVQQFIRKTNDINFIIPLAESISKKVIEDKMRKEGLWPYRNNITIIEGEEDKINAISSCCLALTKPGTITLELAILGIPTVMFYKTSWLTYFLAKKIVKINHMALPNLLLQKPVYKEFIQSECKHNLIFNESWTLYKSFLTKSPRYQDTKNSLLKIRKLLFKNTN